MKLASFFILIVSAAACSKAEGAPETFVKASGELPDIKVAPALPSLDSLIASLDSVRGFYWPRTTRQLELTNANLRPEHFRPHGREAVQRLIDCLPDTTTTSTYLAADMDYKYPRGLLCYEVLRALVDFDESRVLPIRREDANVSLDRAHLRSELQRAKHAWQVIHNAKAYRLRTYPAP
jgi:hypothetical protein